MSNDKQALVPTFLGALLVAVLGFSFSVSAVAEDAADDTRMRDKILENIRPVGQVNISGVPTAEAAPATAAAAPPAAAGAARSGEQVYNGPCKICHAVGVAGAPKVGDKAAWEPRAAKGIDALLTSATKGLNAMPPKGTCADCSADELKAAIEYMLSHSGF